MRETGSPLTHLGVVPKSSQDRNYFLYYLIKKGIRPKNELKVDQK